MAIWFGSLSAILLGLALCVAMIRSTPAKPSRADADAPDLLALTHGFRL